MGGLVPPGDTAGPADKAAIKAGMEQLHAEQCAYRFAEMRRRLGITQAGVAAQMGITPGRVSAVEHAKPGATEPRTLAACVEALGWVLLALVSMAIAYGALVYGGR